MSQQRDIIEQKQGNHIVRIRSDSDTNLDDLFNAVRTNQAPHGVPMRMRNLPPSFFQQPDRGSQSASHSRESSTDNTFTSQKKQPVVQNNNPTNPTSPDNQNNKNNNPVAGAAATLPPNGLQIIHSRAHSSPATLQQTYSVAVQQQQHQHLRQQSYDVTDNIPLPQGWQKAKTDSGQDYFINHLTRTTTWEDPRKNISTGSLSNSSGISVSPASSIINLPNLGPLPDGYEQSVTAEGEIYFINHKDCTTQWHDPRIPIHLQQTRVVPLLRSGISPGQSQSSLPVLQTQTSVPPTPATTSLPSLSSQSSQQQKWGREDLEMERARIRLRQQELLSTSCFGNSMLNDQALLRIRRSLQEGASLPTSPTHTSDSNASSIDPFLNAGSDFHSRQESGDSGVGLCTNYSLPNTPEDYLMGMDEENENALLDIADLNLESLPGTTLDMVPENMDSDDLEPSLQEEFSADILDVEALLKQPPKWL